MQSCNAFSARHRPRDYPLHPGLLERLRGRPHAFRMVWRLWRWGFLPAARKILTLLRAQMWAAKCQGKLAHKGPETPDILLWPRSGWSGKLPWQRSCQTSDVHIALLWPRLGFAGEQMVRIFRPKRRIAM